MAKFTMQTDPRMYAMGVAPKLPATKRVLGLDLGTKCGASFADIVPGTVQANILAYLDLWDLSIGTYDSGALRHIRLKQFLSVLSPDLIMFEDVKYTPNKEMYRGKNVSAIAIVARAATSIEFLGGLKITLCTWAEEHGVPCEGLGIQEIKKFATHKGVANKEVMVEACNNTFGTEFDPKNYEAECTDNVADSAFVMLMGVERYLEGLGDGRNAASGDGVNLEVPQGLPATPARHVRRRAKAGVA